MYELTSHAIAEPMLRAIHQQALPAQQRRREHGRALRLGARWLRRDGKLVVRWALA